MPQTLQEYLNSIPEWHDDNKISGLFASFSNSRAINPEVWDARMDFWRKVITQAAKLSLLGPDSFILNAKDLNRKFERNSLTPLGISTVLVATFLIFRTKCIQKANWIP